MSHEEEDPDSLKQYKFKHLACNERKNSVRLAGFLGTRPILSTLKMFVSILTLCLIVVILAKLHEAKERTRSGQPISAGLEAGMAQTEGDATMGPSSYHYIPSSINEPIQGQFYIIMPTGSKYALTNDAGLISLTSYTFEDNQKFKFSLNGKRSSPKKYSIIDKSDNYFLGLGGNGTKLMGFEKEGAGDDVLQWLIRDQTHREGSFLIRPSTSELCLTFDAQEHSVILEECALFRSTQYWLILPICGDFSSVD